MARERISLVSEEVKQQSDLESRIRTGEINADNFPKLPAEQQQQVNELLFKMASNKVDPNQGASALEFILFGFMRVAMKKINNYPLNSEDMKIQESISRIMDMHDITNDNLSNTDWLFDYMAYAELKAGQFLENRKDHIQRKKQVTGRV